MSAPVGMLALALAKLLDDHSFEDVDASLRKLRTITRTACDVCKSEWASDPTICASSCACACHKRAIYSTVVGQTDPAVLLNRLRRAAVELRDREDDLPNEIRKAYLSELAGDVTEDFSTQRNVRAIDRVLSQGGVPL